MMSQTTAAQVLQLTLVAIVVAVGQVLFKYGSVNAPPADSAAALLRLLLQPVVVLAIALYGLGVVLWIVVLQDVPLTRAYPFMSLGFVLTPLAAVIFFGEAVDLRYLLGTALILAGIYLTGIPR